MDIRHDIIGVKLIGYKYGIILPIVFIFLLSNLVYPEKR